MCIICVDLQKNKLTWKEARRNLGEVHTKLEKDRLLEAGMNLIYDLKSLIGQVGQK